MRIEYTEEQEKELRIAEIESILTNNLYEDEIRELSLEVELQFLQGNTDVYGTPIAYIGKGTAEALEITYEENSYYSMLMHDEKGKPILPYYNADTLESLFKTYFDIKIAKLKAKKDYSFECNLTKEYGKYDSCDEWGCAFVWLGEDIGAEYNFCMDNEENCCAIYKTELSSDKEYMKTDYNTFIHYEIDFHDPEWKEALERAMCRALIKFFDLKIM